MSFAVGDSIQVRDKFATKTTSGAVGNDSVITDANTHTSGSFAVADEVVVIDAFAIKSGGITKPTSRSDPCYRSTSWWSGYGNFLYEFLLIYYSPVKNDLGLYIIKRDITSSTLAIISSDFCSLASEATYNAVSGCWWIDDWSDYSLIASDGYFYFMYWKTYPTAIYHQRMYPGQDINSSGWSTLTTNSPKTGWDQGFAGNCDGSYFFVVTIHWGISVYNKGGGKVFDTSAQDNLHYAVRCGTYIYGITAEPFSSDALIAYSMVDGSVVSSVNIAAPYVPLAGSSDGTFILIQDGSAIKKMLTSNGSVGSAISYESEWT